MPAVKCYHGPGRRASSTGRRRLAWNTTWTGRTRTGRRTPAGALSRDLRAVDPFREGLVAVYPQIRQLDDRGPEARDHRPLLFGL